MAAEDPTGECPDKEFLANGTLCSNSTAYCSLDSFCTGEPVRVPGREKKSSVSSDAYQYARPILQISVIVLSLCFLVFATSRDTSVGVIEQFKKNIVMSSVTIFIVIPKLLELIDLQNEEKILDAGCGSGRYLPHFAGLKNLVVGVDASSYASSPRTI